MTTAVVVGAGPNGLAAAVRLARHGIDVEVLEAANSIGGGTRTSELTVPGLLHDHCSAFHPMAVGSMTALGLERHGLRWRWPDIDCAHPLDGGEVGLLWRSLDHTVHAMGADGSRWRRAFGRISSGYDELARDVMRPMLHVPRHPLRLARFGSQALLPASVMACRFRTATARALFGGIAAHAYQPLSRPASSAVGLAIIAAGHRHGWPVAEGGSRAISDALVTDLAERGGSVRTGVRVTSTRDLPPADLVLFDLAPGAVARILGDRLPDRVARSYRRFRHGPAAFKVDFAIDGPVPWAAPECGRAGTVHLGGDFAEVAAGERTIAAGQMPERPFVLVGQQFVADPSRSSGSLHPLWTYAHVPSGYTGDATAAIVGQIERFAPGFRERIVARAVQSTTAIAAANPNYVGGDIVTGANTLRQLLMRPRPALNPYSVGVRGMYICSAATPPGAGAHGMCGLNAADAALRSLHISPDPSRP
jgi:phytoene dehydrogenase-like protein